jgi:uncharacterized protein (TIGR03086 family)
MPPATVRVMTAAARYGAVANGFTARLTAITPDQWSRPTPCTEWTVRELVAHVIGTQLRVLATLGEADPVEVDPDGDLPAQWAAARDAIMDAVTDPERAATMAGGMFGQQSFESLVGGLLCSDTLVHTWDLARAIGADEQLDADAVAHCAGMLAPMDDAIRRPGGFGGKVEAMAGADAQTAFLNFCGRAV